MGEKQEINILLIDDEEDQSIIVREYLKKNKRFSFTLEQALDYDEAFTRMERKHFDLYIVDYNLGKKTGLDFIYSAGEMGYKEPMIMLTGQGEYEVDVKAMQAGAADYLNKHNLSPEALERCIRNSLDRNQAEREREQLLSRMEAKNDELQDIIYTLSHDLRSPLVNIKGFADELKEVFDILSERLKNAADWKEEDKSRIDELIDRDAGMAFDFLNHSILKIEELVNGLLRLSRVGTSALHMEKLNMNELVTETTKDFQYQLKEREIDVIIEEPLPFCESDRLLVKEVFMNLLSNAVKYSHMGRRSWIKISGREEKGFLVYCVEDNGLGIKEKFLKHIFELFHRVETPNHVTGEGLGLSIVRRIMNRLNGTVSVESELDKGSRFYVSFPL